MAEIAARLDHAGLAVADLGAAASWYCDVLGLVPELTLEVGALDLSIEMLIHPAHRYRLELLYRPGSGAGADGKPATPGEAALREGYGHVAFDVTDLDGAYDRAVARAHGRSCRPARRRNPGYGWRSSPIPRETSSSCCTGQGENNEPSLTLLRLTRGAGAR
jgi:catechol 2,3-dioxygenase-like lactoylglutathione lyase family enzyme